jgi:hypothetical protein
MRSTATGCRRQPWTWSAVPHSGINVVHIATGIGVDAHTNVFRFLGPWNRIFAHHHDSLMHIDSVALPDAATSGTVGIMGTEVTVSHRGGRAARPC